jgi:adenosylcobinamide-GDP ribazoletransferase
MALAWMVGVGGLVAWCAPFASAQQAGGYLGLALVAVALVVFAMWRWLRRRLGGYTGDTLGATEQLAELAVLLALAAR